MLKEPVTAAGGVVFDNEKADAPSVLLIFRRGVWDLPKGKLDEGETVQECALREVAEEVGITVSPQILFDLPETYHEYEMNGTHYGKTTHWFAMELPESDYEFEPQSEEQIEEVRWIPLNEAKKLVGYKNLSKVLNAFEEKLHE